MSQSVTLLSAKSVQVGKTVLGSWHAQRHATAVVKRLQSYIVEPLGAFSAFHCRDERVLQQLGAVERLSLQDETSKQRLGQTLLQGDFPKCIVTCPAMIWTAL